MRFQFVLLPALLAFATPSLAASAPRAHWERVSIQGGSELLTLFAVLPGVDPVAPSKALSREVPLLSVLRDTLDDDNPDNDRLRSVWLLADQRKSRLARWFTTESGPPKPVVDLSAPGKTVWKGVLLGIVQTMMLDPRGAPFRVPSRGYFSNEAASRTVRLYEAVTVLARLEEDAQFGPLAPEEYSRVLSRLLLADRPFGGLVRDRNLERVSERELANRRQALGRNWELLRQRAEAEGLLFQPIAPDGGLATSAMVWISRADLASREPRAFRSKFLAIADPWRDQELRNWKGYFETWYFDSEGRRVDGSEGAVRSEAVIPLGLYSLDHPKAPFLLIDFRSPWKPAAREMARRTVEEVPLTILGVATFTNWQVRGAQLTWNSVRGRRGAAIHRPSRLRAAASVRQAIPSATQIQPEMRAHMQKRLGAVAPSTTRRYDALLEAAFSAEGLSRRIDRDRGRELAKIVHPGRTKWLTLASIATFGLYRHRVETTPQRLDLLNRERRVAHAVRVLEEALAASPLIDVDGNIEQIRRAAHELASISSVRSPAREKAQRLLIRLTEQTSDEDLRREFLAWLHEPRTDQEIAAVPAGGEGN